VENWSKVLSLNGYWNYNWGLDRIAAQDEVTVDSKSGQVISPLEFVPMQWGDGGAQVPQRLQTIVQPHIASGVTRRFLVFNEPDKKDQANMPIERALELWPDLEALNVSLISPSCAATDGPWMEAFMGNATKRCLRVDWVGVHWYGGVSATVFQGKLRSWFKKYGKPLLITEFAPADWTAQSVKQNQHTKQEVLDFAKAMMPWLEAQDWIVGYAWFSFQPTDAVGTTSALFDRNGELTALGRYYASVTTDNPNGDQSIQIEQE